MKEGCQERLHLEASTDESSSDYESSKTLNSEVTSNDIDSFVEVMGNALSQQPLEESNVKDSQLEIILCNSLSLILLLTSSIPRP